MIIHNFELIIIVRYQARTTRIYNFQLDEGFQPYHPTLSTFDVSESFCESVMLLNSMLLRVRMNLTLGE